MSSKFERAIRKTGGICRLCSDENISFAACITPAKDSLDGHHETGIGGLYLYNMYVPFNKITRELVEGTAVIFSGNTYRIRNIMTSYFQGLAVFRQGVLMLLEETND